jgi:hypothetical protein
MKNILLLLPFLLLQACGSSDRPMLAPEAIYGEANMAVITTLFNDAEQTTSILYGNTLAVRAAYDSGDLHQPGEEYQFVTWRQKANPLWFGGQISDSVQTIERVRTLGGDNSVQMQYDVVVGHASSKPLERVQFILGLRGLEFP